MSFMVTQGNALDALAGMPDESVHVCVTSPPFWGLRDYQTATWSGGDSACDHKNKHGIQGATGQRSDRTFTGAQNFYKDTCRRCGTIRTDDQLGLEKTPEEYVARLVKVFREVRRVLRKDGTLFLNLGDSYAGYHGNSKVPDDQAPSNKPGYMENMRASSVTSRRELARRAAACGTSDKAPEDSQDHDCLCGSLCDACRVAYRIGRSHNGSSRDPMPTSSPSATNPAHTESQFAHLPTSDSSSLVGHNEAATLDYLQTQDLEREQPPVSQRTMNDESSLPHQANFRQSARPSECQLCGR